MKRLLSFIKGRRSSVADLPVRACPSPRRGNSLEMLEARIAPAAIATFSKGTLLITGTPDGELDFEQTSEDVNGVTVITTTVTDAGSPLAGASSFVNVKNIVVKLPKSMTTDQSISMDLVKLKGAVEVLAPKAANTTVFITGPGGEETDIGKGILVKGGSGVEVLSLSRVNVAKGVVFAAGKGADSFFAAGDVTIGGGVSALGVPTFTLNPGAEINGQLLITQTENLTEFYVLGSGAKITGNVQIYAGSGSTTINAYATVTGHFFANAAGGPNNFNVALTAKSLTYVGGSGNDFVSLMGGSISGAAKFGLGGGRNDVAFNIGPGALLGDFSVGKNLVIQGGKDLDNFRLDSATEEIRVGGKTAISLGGGDNVLVWNGASTGKKIQINGGGGKDTVNLHGLDALKATLTVNLGGDDDRILLTDQFLKASLHGGSGTDSILVGSVLPVKTKLKAFEAGVPT